MKIILSVDPIKFPLTGIGRYTYELAKQLQLYSDLELLPFANGSFVDDLSAEGQIINPRKADWLKNHLRKIKLVTKAYQVLKEVRAKYALKDLDGAIFHGTNFYVPKFNGACVATFHDLSVLTYAQYHTPERVRYMQCELERTLQRAALLITDSEYIRQEIAAYSGYSLDKIYTIPLACSDAFHPREASSTALILARFGLKQGAYVLYTGTIEPRKNIDVLLDAYSTLPDAVRRRWPLVLAGYYGWRNSRLHARIRAAVSAGWAYYLGYVATEDLPYLFAGARLFVFPSHYEGFGLPVLEALASGVPVICSNSSSLPEVTGGAASLFDPEDIDKLRELILIGLEDEAWRAAAISKGLLQASNFSWQKCARATVDVYQKLAGSCYYL